MMLHQAKEDIRQEKKRFLADHPDGSIGLVPTMGFLHEGHASLIRRARAENGLVVVSIFVNPLQFGPAEDFDRYPRDLAHDLRICEENGADVVFAPTVEEMYGLGPMLTTIHVESLGDHLCGASRPGHFDGVCTVVAKLLQIVQPNLAYFGKKDAQQLRIVKQMTQDLSIPVEIVPCEIVREEDGLAKSSRNAYLSKEDRQVASMLRKTLLQIRNRAQAGETDVNQLIRGGLEQLRDPRIRVDYLQIVDEQTLKPVEGLPGGSAALCAVAAFVGNTRLIDNVEIDL